MISGKNTNRLGVEEIVGPNSERLQVTNLERTLIDIVVRPAYAAGIIEVIKAYRAAKDRMSVNKLLEILKKLDYVYPYHQAIGFLMQQAGYPQEKLCRTARARDDLWLLSEHMDCNNRNTRRIGVCITHAIST